MPRPLCLAVVLAHGADCYGSTTRRASLRGRACQKLSPGLVRSAGWSPHWRLWAGVRPYLLASASPRILAAKSCPYVLGSPWLVDGWWVGDDVEGVRGGGSRCAVCMSPESAAASQPTSKGWMLLFAHARVVEWRWRGPSHALAAVWRLYRRDPGLETGLQIAWRIPQPSTVRSTQAQILYGGRLKNACAV